MLKSEGGTVKGWALVFGIMILLVISVYAQKVDVGARPVGLGGSFVSIVDDANAPAWNPAGMELFKERAISASFSKRLWGIENDNIMEAYFGYVQHLDKRGRYGSLGAYYEQLFTNVYYESALSIGYAKLIWGNRESRGLSLGLNAKILRYGFNEGKFEGVDMSDPLIRGTTSKIAPAFDLGLILRLKQLSVGFMGKNLNQPDLSMSGSGNEAGKVPLEAKLGVSYFIVPSLMFTADAEYSSEKISGSSSISFHGGVEKWFGSTFGVRGGYNRNEGTAGASYIMHKPSFNLVFDYAFVYPFEYSPLTVTTHKFSVGVKFAPPRIPLEDLELSGGRIDISPTELFLGSPITIKATIVNKGEKREKGVPITLYYQDSLGNWVVALKPDPLEIEAGESKQVIYSWTPLEKGSYTLYMSVDDDGTKLPRVHGKIEEEDEDNNTGSGKFEVYLPTLASIAPQDRKLEVSKMTVYQEEEPIVPIAFFAERSSDLDPRFDRMLQTVAERLRINPDIILYLRGYYDKSETTRAVDLNVLARSRAESVRSRLISLGAPENRVVVVSEGYDPSLSRSGRPDIQLNPKDKRLQLEENRRVELSTSVKNADQYSVEIELRDKTLSPEAESVLKEKLNLMKELLVSNPEIIIMAEGFVSGKGNEVENQAFLRAGVVAKWLKKNLPDELADRVYLVVGKGNRGDLVSVYPEGDGVIYRPREGERVIEDYSVLGNEENTVRIDAKIEAGVDSFAVSIIDDKGERVRLLAAGKGELPRGLAWDWRDEAGQMLDFDRKYFCKLDLWDRLGEKVTARSDTMAIEVVKSAKKIETLIIVEFLFNEDTPQSKFLESRIEYVAKRFIARAKKMPTKLYAYVKGYTDVIGAEYANRALSQVRANRELENLKRYLMYLLDISSPAELNEWLVAHNVELKALGLWENEPYTIVRYDKGKAERVLLGDNNRPEGRTINRRVILELRSEKTIEAP